MSSRRRYGPGFVEVALWVLLAMWLLLLVLSSQG